MQQIKKMRDSRPRLSRRPRTGPQRSTTKTASAISPTKSSSQAFRSQDAQAATERETRSPDDEKQQLRRSARMTNPLPDNNNLLEDSCEG